MMRRRGVLIGGLAAGGLALGGAGAAFRWHATPRRFPYLQDEHLQSLLSLPPTPRRVLFVGNSFTHHHDMPAQVAALAAAEGVSLQVAVAAANGARLIETWRIPVFRDLLLEGWDALVLQDLSTMVLRAPDRWGAEFAMRAMAEALVAS